MSQVRRKDEEQGKSGGRSQKGRISVGEYDKFCAAEKAEKD